MTMRITTTIQLVCSKHRPEWTAADVWSYGGQDFKEALQKAKDAGWHFVDDKQFCPKCTNGT